MHELPPSPVRSEPSGEREGRAPRMKAREGLAPPMNAPEAAPPPDLAAELQALPPLPAPLNMWRRVGERTAQRRVQRRRRATFALAAGLATALVAAALVGLPDAPPSGLASETAALPANPQHLAANRHAVLRLPAATSAEHLVRARIGGIDATLNRRLLQGDVDSRPALLRQRAALMESLVHIERHRAQAIVQAVY